MIRPSSLALAVLLLLPLALRLFSVNEGGLARKWLALDWLLVTYLVLQLAVLSPYETPTATMRRGSWRSGSRGSTRCRTPATGRCCG